MKNRKLTALALIALGLTAAFPAPALARGEERPFEADDTDLTELSLDDLMRLEVSVATRSAERLQDVPAAVYVLTGDEIRRAGHSSVPEALRMVPGFHVSRWTTQAWDVTSRGFGPGLSLTSLAYNNQLLVMIDGVVVYTPLFAGVWWPLQDLDLNDVDRIEIVRGPGGILWGANAVHGVVHVITKHTESTQGLQAGVRSSEEDSHAALRYGSETENGFYRGWVKGADYDTLHNAFGGFDYDYEIYSTGLRSDWSDESKDFTIWARGWNGGFENLGYDLTTFAPIQVRDQRKGLQLYGSMTDVDDGSKLQAWFATDQQDLVTLVDIGIDVADIEYTRPLDLEGNHDVTFGVGVRGVHSRLRGDDPFWLDFDPQNSVQMTYRAFAVDNIAVPEKDLNLTLACTLEHNSFTQLEIQPTARLAWNPREDLMAWASASRAVRTPSLEENSLSTGSFFVGTKEFRSEVLLAYEAGVRHVMNERVSLDLAAFYNDYDRLHIAMFDGGTGLVQLTNNAKGKSWGTELAMDLKPLSRWSLRGAVSIHHGQFETENGFGLSTDEYTPSRTVNLRSYYDLGNHWELDAGLYVVNGMGEDFEVAEYTRGDVRVGWNPNDEWKLFVGVHGIGDETRPELDTFDNPGQTAFVGVIWTP
jgi:iron complex outermembrane receptor protein